MKSHSNFLALMIAVVAMQMHFDTVAHAQTYQDILKQVSEPGFLEGNAVLPKANKLPSIDTIPGQPVGEFTTEKTAPAAFNPAGPSKASKKSTSSLNNKSTGYQFVGSKANNSITPNASSLEPACNAGNCVGKEAVSKEAVSGKAAQPENIYSPAYTSPLFDAEETTDDSTEVASAADGDATPVANPLEDCVAIPEQRGSNLVFGVYGLVFDRDYEDDLSLVCNDVGDALLSTNADVGNFGGLEFFMGVRNNSGLGLDLRYWGLFTNEASFTLTGASFTSHLPALSNVTWPANGSTIVDVINGSTANNVHRDNEIHNVEINSLRNVGCFTTRRGRLVNYELLAGFRWFEFDEEFHWDITSPTAPNQLFFDNNVQNTLLGFQVGGLTELCLTERWRLNAGTKLGLFNNRARAEQILQDDAGQFASVDGSAYFFRNTKDDLSMLGELNLAVAYHLNPCSRITVGYRALGVSGIALGANQLNNFSTVAAITDIQTNANLLLHGTFFGFEFCR